MPTSDEDALEALQDAADRMADTVDLDSDAPGDNALKAALALVDMVKAGFVRLITRDRDPE